MATSRKRILEYLHRHQTASAREIGRFLGVTTADARHHLAQLEVSGLVETLGRQTLAVRGRPARVYRLTRMVLGDNLDNLTSAVLSSYLKGLAPGEQSDALRDLAGQMSGSVAGDAFSPEGEELPITHRLSQLVDRLNSWHYQSRWEAGVAGPRIILGYCPYAAILRQHPELCMLDAQILQRGLGFPVRQTGRLAHTERGMLVCTFLVMVPPD